MCENLALSQRITDSLVVPLAKVRESLGHKNDEWAITCESSGSPANCERFPAQAGVLQLLEKSTSVDVPAM